MASIVRETKIVVLKPNFVVGRSAETGATTSFALLKAVTEEVHYEACPENAISVKGYSGTGRPS